jgi:hypothetical protein
VYGMLQPIDDFLSGLFRGCRLEWVELFEGADKVSYLRERAR